MHFWNAFKRLRIQGRGNREDAGNTHSNGGRIYAFYYERKNPAAEKDRLGEKQHFTGNINFEFKSYVQEQSKITGCINLRIDMSVGWAVRRKCINSWFEVSQMESGSLLVKLKWDSHFPHHLILVAKGP